MSDAINPSHYKNHPSGVECVDVTRYLGFLIGNAVKYVWRRGEKGRESEDLNKALWYVQRARREGLAMRYKYSDDAPLRRYLELEPTRFARDVIDALWRADGEPNNYIRDVVLAGAERLIERELIRLGASIDT